MDCSWKDLLAQLMSLPSMDPSKPGAGDVKTMQAWADQAEILFWLAGRHQANTGVQGTFTGLMSDAPF